MWWSIKRLWKYTLRQASQQRVLTVSSLAILVGLGSAGGGAGADARMAAKGA